jgi:hypothetical protein
MMHTDSTQQKAAAATGPAHGHFGFNDWPSFHDLGSLQHHAIRETQTDSKVCTEMIKPTTSMEPKLLTPLHPLTMSVPMSPKLQPHSFAKQLPQHLLQQQQSQQSQHSGFPCVAHTSIIACPL